MKMSLENLLDYRVFHGVSVQQLCSPEDVEEIRRYQDAHQGEPPDDITWVQEQGRTRYYRHIPRGFSQSEVQEFFMYEQIRLLTSINRVAVFYGVILGIILGIAILGFLITGIGLYRIFNSFHF